MHFHASARFLYTHIRRSWWGGVGGGMLTLLLIRTLSICCYAAEISGVVATLCARRDGVWHVNVPATSYVTCCYAADISGVVATLQRSLVLLLHHVHERVGLGGHVDVPANSDVICCYAAEISGVVATLQRSLALLLRCRDLCCCCYGVCTKGCGKGKSMLKFLLLRTLYVATLQTSLVLLLRCRDLCCCCYGVYTKGWGWGGLHVNVPATLYVICCYAAEISGVLATLQRSLVLKRHGRVQSPCLESPCCSFQLPTYLQKFPIHSFQLMVSDTVSKSSALVSES